MAENVIRRDVIQLGFDIDNSPLKELHDELNKMKKTMSKAFGDDVFEDMADDAKKAKKPIEDIGDEAEKAEKPLDEIAKKNFSGLTSSLKGVGSALGTVAAKAAKISFAGIAAGAAAVGKITYEAVQAYGEFEQLKGGMEKIFDKADISGIMTDANNAYKDLGLSANDYLRIINDTGATFAAVMGDQKGYETAKTGLTAISDYASGTGKSVDVLGEKFSMITRSTSSYQSIADQFSGILPATSKDFLKQAQAAGFLEKKYSKLTDVPIAEYQESVSKMLEKGVADLGLAGNTAAEATGTLTGSLGMAKAAWGNLMSALGSGEGLDQCIDNMVDAGEALLTQLMKVIPRALTGIGTLLERVTPIIAEKLPQLAKDLLPPLIKAAVSLFSGLVKALPSIIQTVLQTAAEIIGEEIPILGKAFSGLAGASDIIAKFTPLALGLVGAFMAFKKIQGVVPIITGLFSKGGGGGSDGGKGGGNIFSSIAKMNPKTIGKAMVNIGIIVGGLAIMTAGIMAVAPLMADLSDAKSLIEVVGVMSAVGALGVAMTKASKKIGKIPVSTVAKGLANMAILVGGLSVLTLLVGAVSLINFDYGAMMEIIGIMGALGLVGGAMTVVAGVLGVIPIPVVLLGLANMALVLGGVSLLITAFGALNQIPGFHDFIKSGGEVLASVFRVIGDCVGSLIGGAIEGISKSLPVLGQNLAMFAQSIAPMFQVFQGVDMNGVGTFFTAIGGFMLAMAGEGLASLLTGGVDFTGLANGLGTLANSEGVRSFFSMVDTLPETAFNKGKLFFECLDGISSLPNIGGITQLFTGTNDFEGTATGLGQLTSEGVKNFFAMVDGFAESAFNKGKLFFETLDGISSLPNAGGLGQLFTGKNDFEGVTSGLTMLAGEGVRSFFSMVNGFEESAYTKGKLFFETLDGISELPNVGGLTQAFTGTNDFAGTSEGLKQLSSQGVKNFFAMVSGLDMSVFVKTIALFNALGDISKLNNAGGFLDGLKSMFGGKDEKSPIAQVAESLGEFATKSVSFFTLLATVNPKKISELWNSLANASLIAQTDTKSLPLTGTHLSEFMGNASGFFLSCVMNLPFVNAVMGIANALSSFFAEVNGIVITSLPDINQAANDLKFIILTISQLPDIMPEKGRIAGMNFAVSIRDAMTLSLAFINSGINEIVKKVSELPIKMGDGIKSSGDSLKTALVTIWQNAVTACAKPVNKLIEGANWILKEFGSNKKIVSWTPYARGTSGHKGGNALVNDGRGAELIQMPNGRMFIPRGRNVFLPNAPKGMKVLSAEKTANLLGKTSPTFRYAKGTGDFDIYDYENNPKGLIDYMKQNHVTYDASEFPLHAGKSLVTMVSGEMVGWVKKLFDEFGGGKLVSTCRKYLGVPYVWGGTSPSGFDCSGLMQYVYAECGKAIPRVAAAQFAAGMPVANPRRGDLVFFKGALGTTSAPGHVGMYIGNGQMIHAPKTGDVVRTANAFRGDYLGARRYTNGVGEVSIPTQSSSVDVRYTPESTYRGGDARIENNTYAPVFNLTITGTNDDRAMARKVKQWIREEMEEIFDSMSRRNPKLQTH